MKDKQLTAILCFLFGYLGMHRFYLRQPGLGVLYIVFFWTLIPSIVAFVEWIRFILMDEYEFDRLYNDRVHIR